MKTDRREIILSARTYMHKDDYFQDGAVVLSPPSFLVTHPDFTLTAVRADKKVKVRPVRKTPGYLFLSFYARSHFFYQDPAGTSWSTTCIEPCERINILIFAVLFNATHSQSTLRYARLRRIRFTTFLSRCAKVHERRTGFSHTLAARINYFVSRY